jgi:putative nucleotidyltransferase with HDIG domain
MLVNEIITRLHDNNFEVFYVGGVVRDYLLGKEAKDIDLCTNAKPEQIEKIFYDKTICYVGKNFKVTIVDNIEIATYRLDRQEQFFNAKYCTPQYATTIEEDLARRDLTCNAIAINAITGDIIDPYEGRKDLEQGIIRFVGDPYERIKEDPCRILRACRFLAAIEGTFTKETLEALTTCAHHVNTDVELERIQLEILKVLTVKTPSIFFSALQTIGALKYIFFPMVECFNHTGGEYHKETVGEHLMLTGDLISPKFPIIRLAGFLHDVGKPKAFKIEKDGSFKAHEIHGANIAASYLKRLKFSNVIIKEIVGLINTHMRICRSLTPKGIRKLKKHLSDNEINPRSFLRLKIADRSANISKSKNEIQPIRELIINSGIKSTKDSVVTLKDLAISGGDLINEFSLSPGPIVGKLHKLLLDFIIEEGEELNTYTILRNKAEDIINYWSK